MTWENFIGRRAETSDCLTSAALARFCATLDRETEHREAPQGIHWCLCLPDAPTADLGIDGHPRRDDSAESFMPPIPLPRRMWAASDVRFHAPIQSGAQVHRISTISSITAKEGASGALVFVTVDHENHMDDQLVVSESQSIVFREAPAPRDPIAVPAASSPAAPAVAEDPDLSQWQWHRKILPNSALLFRYSALTFNSHRIHYDAPYATAEEGYEDLVVHGPLISTLLLDLAQRELGLNSLKYFKMRAQAPAFANRPLHLVGREDGEGGYILAALDPNGTIAMSAKAG